MVKRRWDSARRSRRGGRSQVAPTIRSSCPDAPLGQTPTAVRGAAHQLLPQTGDVTALAQRLKERFFRPEDHPYSILEREIDAISNPADTLLDAGCGRTAPVLARYRGRGARLVGVDLVDFDPCRCRGIDLHKSDLARMPIAPDSVDLIMARSVMEHLTDPEAVYREMHRVLKPGGQVVFITGNLWDYSAIIAKLIPNRHPPLDRREDRGPRGARRVPRRVPYQHPRRGRALGATNGVRGRVVRYRGQYPSYFMFNGCALPARDRIREADQPLRLRSRFSAAGSTSACARSSSGPPCATSRLLTIVIILVPVASARPWIGALAWNWIGMMSPHRLTFGFAYSFPGRWWSEARSWSASY